MPRASIHAWFQQSEGDPSSIRQARTFQGAVGAELEQIGGLLMVRWVAECVAAATAPVVPGVILDFGQPGAASLRRANALSSAARRLAP